MRINRALFLDLDGTIITTKSGEKFPKTVNDWKFLSGVLAKIKYYSDEGFYICIVANIGGIELGYTTVDFVNGWLTNISQEIENYIHAGISVTYCPDMESFHRKPSPGMAYELAIKLELTLSQSIMIGDSGNDKEFAERAGIGEFIHINDFTGIYG